MCIPRCLFHEMLMNEVELPGQRIHKEDGFVLLEQPG